MSRNLRLVPWSTWQEWATVKDLIFSEAPADVSLALQRIGAWRCRGRLPVAVESTANLLQVTLADNQRPLVNTRGGCAVTDLRLSYAMALLRMVNGIIDPEQKFARAQSVSDIAVTLGLPPHFVDLRHEATHNELPQMRTLRKAAAEALTWLHKYYWDAQAAELASTFPTEKVTHLLTKYKALSKTKVGTEDDKPALDQIYTLVASVKRRELKETLVASLMQEGFLLPRSSQDRALQSFEIFDTLDSAKQIEIAEAKLVKQLKNWGPVLVRFQERWGEFPRLLLEHVVDMLALITGDSVRRRLEQKKGVYLLYWALWLVKEGTSVDGTRFQSKTGGKMFSNALLEDVGATCLKNLNDFTQPILDAVVMVLGEENDWCVRVQPLIAFHKLMDPDAKPTVDGDASAAISLDEMEALVQEPAGKRRRLLGRKSSEKVTGLATLQDMGQSGSAWVTPTSWDPAPIGTAIGGGVTDLPTDCLPLHASLLVEESARPCWLDAGAAPAKGAAAADSEGEGGVFLPAGSGVPVSQQSLAHAGAKIKLFW